MSSIKTRLLKLENLPEKINSDGIDRVSLLNEFYYGGTMPGQVLAELNANRLPI